MQKIIYATLIFLFLFNKSDLWCQDNQNTFQLDSLNWINKEVHAFHLHKLELLKLEKVTNGFDSMKIRIFINHSLSKPDRIVELSLVDKKWKGILINYNLAFNHNEDRFFVTNIEKKAIEPKMSWNQLINNLIESSLLTLPDEDLIKNYPTVVDGISYCVEISTPNYYRFYCFSNPDIAKENIEEAKNMDYIIEKIYSEFKIK